jgi:hypothetical protein
VQLDGLVGLQILFAQEDVEVGVLLDRHLNVVRVLWTAARGVSEATLFRLSFTAFLHSSGSLLIIKLIMTDYNFKAGSILTNNRHPTHPLTF